MKIRGHRVELGEVEAAVAGCPGVKGAVAVVAGEREHLFAVAIPAISEAPIASISERSPVENLSLIHIYATARSASVAGSDREDADGAASGAMPAKAFRSTFPFALKGH